jgi:hypothetical protein
MQATNQSNETGHNNMVRSCDAWQARGIVMNLVGKAAELGVRVKQEISIGVDRV